MSYYISNRISVIGSFQLVQMLVIMGNFHQEEGYLFWSSPVELIREGQLGGEKALGYPTSMEI